MNSGIGFISRVLSVAAALAVFGGCKVSYTLSGASIDPAVRSVSIAYFPNNASMVSPMLSTTFTDALKDKFSRQTKLDVVREGGDMNFEGEITNYTSTPSSVSGETQRAAMNRLTITVRVRFTNRVQPAMNYSRSFSAYDDYPSTTFLQEAEATLIPQIVDKLIEDIFNAAVSNW